MTSQSICRPAPAGLDLARRAPQRNDLAGLWNRLLDASGWTAWRVVRARAELLRLAATLDATEPSYAADLRAAALADTDDYSSSTLRGQLALSSRESERSASSRPPVWQRAQ